MADVSAHTPVFSRGSTVLDYWLAHAEGLTVQPSGARVEEVVATPPVGRPETLIVRSRMMRRRKEIPADSIAAVDPSSGHLLLDATAAGAPLRIPRPSPEQLAGARVTAARGGRMAQAGAVSAARLTEAGSRSALSWLRPRVVRASHATGRQTQLAVARSAAGARWLAPRISIAARTTCAIAMRFALATAAILARGAARAAQGAEHGASLAATRSRASLEARRARQARRPGDPED
jgi:hypothetical protein